MPRTPALIIHVYQLATPPVPDDAPFPDPTWVGELFDDEGVRASGFFVAGMTSDQALRAAWSAFGDDVAALVHIGGGQP